MADKCTQAEIASNDSKTTQTVYSFKERDTVLHIINGVSDICDDNVGLESDLEKFTNILDAYQEQPHLLDPYLEELVNSCLMIVRDEGVKEKAFHQTFRYLYLICKTRGAKCTLRYFTHEVADLEPVLNLLIQQNVKDFTTWQTRYILILWLSIICIIPFDLIKFHRSFKDDDEDNIVQRILRVSKTYIDVADKSRDAAALLLAKFLSRPDVNRQNLPKIMEWLLVTLSETDISYTEGLNSTFGILTVMDYSFKHGNREDLLQYANDVLDKVEERSFLSTDNILLKKLAVKLIQRLGLCFLKPKVASWRYQRGNRSLLYNLQNPFGIQDNKQHFQLEENNVEESYNIPESIESVIQHLLLGLRDRDTVVRWSAAKGLGRVSNRLPKELVDDIIATLLDYFSPNEVDAGLHGGCLAFAELGRRGLLLPERLSEVVPILVKALIFDEKRGKFNAGAHVRDAACYVCWSFARAYDPDALTDFINIIASSLVMVSIFDREPNCRRAASAAFQEHVGRQGKFPHGIDIVANVDYFSVGNITNCYLILSVYVAKFPEYTTAIVDHLVHNKIYHWDSSIRTLSAKALGKLTPVAPEYVKTKVLPVLLKYARSVDLNERHGGILATSEVVFALYQYFSKSTTDTLFTEDILQNLKDIVPNLESKNYFSGVEGDLMNTSVCKFIERLSMSKVPFGTGYVKEYWQEVLDRCLPHTIPEIQEMAADTLYEMSKSFYQTSEGLPLEDIQESLIQNYLAKLKSSLKFDRMGFALGLGALPASLIRSEKYKVLYGLIDATLIDEPNAGLYAESRRDAIKSLARICKELGFCTQEIDGNCINKEDFLKIMECFLRCLEDYSTDRRGDVGAWVRESAMAGIEQLCYLVTNKDQSWLSAEMTKRIICGLAQQSAEKIDRTRALAGDILHRVIHSQPTLPHVPHHQELQDILPREEIGQINWAAPTIAFPLITQFLHLSSYRKPVMLGLIVSAGGLTESLVRSSSQSFLQYFQSIQDNDKIVDEFMIEFMSILQDNHKKDRITVPFLRVVDLFISNGCFDTYVENPRQDVLEKLLLLIKIEVQRSGDAKKLVYAIKVYCGMIQFSGETRKRSLSQLMSMLCHRYPSVRRETAENIYTAFITYEDVVKDESLEEILAILSETEWDGCLEDLRKTRNNLCSLIEVPVPKLKKKNENRDSAGESDVLGSYQDLVTRHGY